MNYYRSIGIDLERSAWDGGSTPMKAGPQKDHDLDSRVRNRVRIILNECIGVLGHPFSRWASMGGHV